MIWCILREISSVETLGEVRLSHVLDTCASFEKDFKISIWPIVFSSYWIVLFLYLIVKFDYMVRRILQVWIFIIKKLNQIQKYISTSPYKYQADIFIYSRREILETSKKKVSIESYLFWQNILHNPLNPKSRNPH